VRSPPRHRRGQVCADEFREAERAAPGQDWRPRAPGPGAFGASDSLRALTPPERSVRVEAAAIEPGDGARVPTSSWAPVSPMARWGVGNRMADPIRIEKFVAPAEGHAVRVIANGAPVAVFQVGGALYALDARCPHVGGPLDRGPIQGTRVTCPLHGSVFDVRDGALVRGPATRGAATFRARQDGDALLLEPLS
jgi:nitrite reductase/ring-hydroxylating ferredoxin subunit